jgi:hypothetical protein
MYWWTRSSMTFHAEIDDDDGDERRQQDEPDREAVDAERVPDVEARDPGVLLGELHRRGAEVEAGDERDRDEKARDRGDQRRPAHRVGAVVATESEQQTPATMGSQMAMLRSGMFLLFAGAQRPIMLPRKGQSCQVMRPITPTIMTSAYQ